MSKKGKAYKKSQQSRRISLQPYLGEILEFRGKVSDFGYEQNYGLEITSSATVLLTYLKTKTNNIRLNHVWLKITPEQRNKFNIGERILFYGKVVRYSVQRINQGKSEEIYKFGLEFDENHKIEILGE